MGLFVAAGFVFIVAAAALWHFYAVRSNRRRAQEVLRWLEASLAGQGHVVGLRWLNASHFSVPVRMATSIFREASVKVQLTPREHPWKWMVNRRRNQQETLTFEADLDLAPAFSLEVQNHRWFARTSKKLDPNVANWDTEQTGPFVLTTRLDWQREINTFVNSLMSSRQREFDKVIFRRTSPHFSATVPLDTIAPGSQRRCYLFDSLRELAAGASTTSY